MYKELLTSRHGDTFMISLNRPEKLNAFTKTMQDELIRVFDYTDQNDDIKSVVITGEGRAYCAGADLVDGPNTFNYAEEGNRLSNDDHRDGGGLVALRIFRSKKGDILLSTGHFREFGSTEGKYTSSLYNYDGLSFNVIEKAKHTFNIGDIIFDSDAMIYGSNNKLIISEEGFQQSFSPYFSKNSLIPHRYCNNLLCLLSY